MQYFESLLQEVKEETEREISSTVEKAVTVKLQKLQAKLDRSLKEKNVLIDVSHSFMSMVLDMENHFSSFHLAARF